MIFKQGKAFLPGRMGIDEELFTNIFDSSFTILITHRNIADTINEQLSGQFKDDKKNGKGTLYYADGTKYVGDWVDDQKAGQGVCTWTNGNRYEKNYSQISSTLPSQYPSHIET